MDEFETEVQLSGNNTSQSLGIIKVMHTTGITHVVFTEGRRAVQSLVCNLSLLKIFKIIYRISL